jgi:sulfite exporter TauE/SafE
VTALALTVLTASLLGSLHCAGMCGGFVAFYAGDPDRRGERSRLAGHLSYNLGPPRRVCRASARWPARSAPALDATGGLLGVQRAAAVVAGVLIVLWGVAALLESRGVRLPRLPAPSAVRGLLRRGIQRVAGAAAGHARARDRPAHGTLAVRVALRLRGDGGGDGQRGGGRGDDGGLLAGDRCP